MLFLCLGTPYEILDSVCMRTAAQVDLKHVEHFISVVGAFEDQIFQKRARLLQRQKQRRERDKANSNRSHGSGQGQAGSKWKAAVPNASFTASLQPVGQHQSGNPAQLHLVLCQFAGGHELCCTKGTWIRSWAL